MPARFGRSHSCSDRVHAKPPHLVSPRFSQSAVGNTAERKSSSNGLHGAKDGGGEGRGAEAVRAASNRKTARSARRARVKVQRSPGIRCRGGESRINRKTARSARRARVKIQRSLGIRCRGGESRIQPEDGSLRQTSACEGPAQSGDSVPRRREPHPTGRRLAPPGRAERGLAEREGFEPPEPFRVQWFSRPPPSTTRPSLRPVDFSRKRPPDSPDPSAALLALPWPPGLQPIVVGRARIQPFRGGTDARTWLSVTSEAKGLSRV
jgi:hypothetical protein